MILIARGSSLLNLRQFGYYVFKLSIKAFGEDEVLNGASREKISMCGFMHKVVEHGLAQLEHGRDQFEQGERDSKNAHF